MIGDSDVLYICIFHISAIQYDSAGFYSVHPFVYFDVLHLKSLTVWIHMGSTLRHIPYKIAHSFVTGSGPESFTKLKCSDSR